MENRDFIATSKYKVFDDPSSPYHGLRGGFLHMYELCGEARLESIRDIVTEVRENEMKGGTIHVLFHSKSEFVELANDSDYLRFCMDNEVHPIYGEWAHFYDLYDEQEYSLGLDYMAPYLYLSFMKMSDSESAYFKRCMRCMRMFDGELTACPHCGYSIETKETEKRFMQPGTVLHGRYLVGIAFERYFGAEYIGWDKSAKQKVVIKEFLPSYVTERTATGLSIPERLKERFNSDMATFLKEAKGRTLYLKDEGFEKSLNCFLENLTAYEIVEYLTGETVSQLLKRENVILEDRAVGILMPVFKALEHASSLSGYLHRSIKPDNILITAEGAKLLDGGTSVFHCRYLNQPRDIILTPGYSAEEQYDLRKKKDSYTDVYSLAATLFTMVTGQRPPEATDLMFEGDKIKNALDDCNISQRRKKAILHAMEFSAKKRTQTVGRFLAELDPKNASPLEYNSLLYERFYKDLKNDNLPDIPVPSKAVIEAYEKKWYEKKERFEKYDRPLNYRAVQANMSIPIEVEIWVDRVFDYYFYGLKPLLAGIHADEPAKKALYEYAGYTWYGTTQLYPMSDIRLGLHYS